MAISMVNKKLVHWALVSCLFVDLKGERSELPENYDNNKLIIIPELDIWRTPVLKNIIVISVG